MELTQLRYFLEVAQSEHMTSSAQRLHIAQPALSQAIKRLESELNVPLFEKRGRNIALTAEGRFFYEKLSVLMGELDALPEALRAMAHVEQHTVYVNVLAASSLVTKAIMEYQEKHRDVRFQLMQNSEAETFDIQISTKMFFRQEQGDTNQRVFNEKIYLAVPKQGKYGDLSSISLAQTENDGFITLAGSRQFRFICDKFCRHAGITPRYIFESDNPAAVQDMIASNIGIGFWPQHSWGGIDNEKVRLLPISQPECSRDIIISCSKYSQSPCAKEFYAYLVNKLNEIMQ